MTIERGAAAERRVVAAPHEERVRTRPRPDCPVCGRTGRQRFAAERDRLFGAPGTWRVSSCPAAGCGTQWLDPVPLESDLPKLYATYHTHTVDDRENDLVQRMRNASHLGMRVRRRVLAQRHGYRHLGDDEEAGWAVRALARLPFLQHRAGRDVLWLDARAEGALLDIGCGAGELMAQMRQLGWTCTGIEFDPAAAHVARRRSGAHVFGSLDEVADGAAETFDAAIMSHVIEHVHEPGDFIAHAAGLLKPGGVLVMVTPNLRSLGHWWFGRDWRGLEVPRHLQLFTAPGLAALARRAGLTGVEAWSSAEHADSMWAESTLLRRNATEPGPTRHEALFSLAASSGRRFRQVERMLGWLGIGCGEELVVRARKRALP